MDEKRASRAEEAAAIAISQAKINALQEHLIASQQRDKESLDARVAPEKIAATKKAG